MRKRQATSVAPSYTHVTKGDAMQGEADEAQPAIGGLAREGDGVYI